MGNIKHEEESKIGMGRVCVKSIFHLKESITELINIINQVDKSGIRDISISSKILKLLELNR